MSSLKYWIADKFFTKELDDAYQMGIRYGRALEVTEFKIAMEIYKPNNLTKTQALGYDRAVEIADLRRNG